MKSMNLTLRLSAIVFSLIFLSPSVSHAQFEVGMGYLHSTPRGPMSTNMNGAGHGFSLDIAYRIPRTNLSVGLQFAESRYGFEERKDTYRFANGYEGDVNVEIYNYFSNNNAYLKYDLLKEAFAQPYLFIGGGLSRIYTDLSIMDPREVFTSDCPKPLETTTLLKDRTSYLLLGGGMRFDLSYPIKSLERRKLLLDIRLNYLNGGEVRYMSLNKSNSNPSALPAENILISFASAAQPEIIHEYHAGSSFQSRMQLITVNAGLVFVFGNEKLKIREFLDNF
jgi:hypothetical protein